MTFRASRWRSGVRVRAALAVTSLVGALVVSLGSLGPAQAAAAGPPPDRQAQRDRDARAAERELPARGPVRVVAVRLEPGGAPDIEVTTTSGRAAAEAEIERLRTDRTVHRLEVDRKVRALDHPVSTDPLRPQQWGMTRLEAEHLWGATKGAGAVVAVVDTGADGNHPDLKAALVPGGECFTNPCTGTGLTDPNGHGTHVSGVVAAVAGNGIGVVGLAPAARVMPVQVLDATGAGWEADVARGIRYAVDKGADVVNLSLGGDYSPSIETAVSYALTSGVSVVAAAGNERQSGNPTAYPAAQPGVIAVAATTSADVSASFSNTGPYVAVAAPGQSIVSTFPTAITASGYRSISGTSMASPHVAATAAALLAVSPDLTPARIREIVMATAEDLETAGYDEATGAGLVDPVAAVASLGIRIVPPPPPPPTRLPGLPRDWNGDGKADVLAAASSGALYLYPGNGAGGWGSRRQIGSGWGARDQLVVTGDWNGDRRPDLIARNPSNGDLWLYVGSGTGGFLSAKVVGRGWNGFDAILSPSDWNGDGRVDLVARRTSDGALFLYPGNGIGGFLTPAQIGNGWGSLSQLTVAGDWDTDGYPDLIARDSSGGLRLYSGNGRGGFRSSRVIGSGWGSFTTLFGPGDFSGDARPDVIGVLPDGSMRLYPSDGYGGYRSYRLIGSGWSTFRIAR